MNAGKTNIEVGTKIKITAVKDFEDKELIGKTGRITHPFGFCSLGDEICGVYLDESDYYGNQTNLLIGDKFEIVQ